MSNGCGLNLMLSSIRKNFTRESLLYLCQGAMSDEDTNGNNGIEYLHHDAYEFFDITEEELKEKQSNGEDCSRYTTDNYFFEKLMDYEEYPKNMSESEIVSEYFELYSETMINYVDSGQEFDTIIDENGKVIAIAYAYC